MAGVTRSRETKNGAISNLPIIFAESSTWACPVAMEAYVFVIGAGGSGSSARRAATSTAGTHQGAGAGGCAVSKLTLAAQNYTVTIGAGGASGGTQASNDSSLAGSDGGASSFAGTGISTMTGNGGAGGAVSNVSNGAVSSAAAGGTATGGTLMNNTGGSSPALTDNSNPSLSSGGGVGLWGPGQDGQAFVGTGYTYLEGGKPQGRDGLELEKVSSAVGEARPWTSYILGLVSAETAVNDSYYQTRQYAPPGAAQTGDEIGGYYYTAAGLVATFPSGPLSGGPAMRRNLGIRRGGCSLGGGGGASTTVNYNSYSYRDSGGSGGVIIIPISIGL